MTPRTISAIITVFICTASMNVYSQKQILKATETDTLDNFFDFYRSPNDSTPAIGITVMWRENKIRYVTVYPNGRSDTLYYHRSDAYTKTRWYMDYIKKNRKP